VEQNFAIAERLRLINTPASEAKEAESLKAPLDKRPAEHLEVTARAQEICADVFGAARPNRTGARLDKGVKNKSKLPRHRLVRTEAEWLRRRRADVAATALGQRHALVAEPIPPDLNARPAGWTDAHEAVLCKQRNKARMRLDEAASDNLLLDSELTADVLDGARDRAAKDAAIDKTRAATARRHARLSAMVRRKFAWERIAGKTAWVGGDGGPDAAAVRRELVRRGLLLTNDRLLADVYVVESPKRPGERVTWCAALKGAVVLSFKQVCSGTGAFLQCKAAVQKKKEVYISPDFRHRHAEITRVVQAATTWPFTRWKIVQTEAAFVTRSAVKTAGAVALCCTTELDSAVFMGLQVMDKTSFINSNRKLDSSNSGITW
jgi:hypothetical protein